MARIKLVEQNEATGAEKERYDELAGRNAVTNMKKGLLNDAATYDAYMAWYTSWNRLVEVAVRWSTIPLTSFTMRRKQFSQSLLSLSLRIRHQYPMNFSNN